jgi:hypothetical protein
MFNNQLRGDESQQKKIIEGGGVDKQREFGDGSSQETITAGDRDG